MKLLQNNLQIFLLIFVTLLFFSPFFLQGKIPIPADTIVGLYHPYRDFYAKDYPNGIPFKNFLITDPVRQQYPWKHLVIDLLKKGELPLWNPYNFTGTPLLGNFQTGVFYPLNFLFIFPFVTGWSLFIVLEPMLASIFMFYYLRSLKISKWASFLGGIVFAFCGFSIAWMEWGNIVHTALWMPLILLSIDKIFFYYREVKIRTLFVEIHKYYKWPVIYIFALASSFFAGHLQIFFYLFLVTCVYSLTRWFQYKKEKKFLMIFAILSCVFLFIVSIQLVSTLLFILNSARNIDQSYWQKEGWFIPWQHLVQFIAPDFFGNPTTLNYWGVWNYGELVGYIGIFPLTLVILSIFSTNDKKILFFNGILFIALIFSLPTPIAQILYILQVPLLSTSQPTRLLFLIDFSLAVLVAAGFDLLSLQKKKILFAVGFLALVLLGLWTIVLTGNALGVTITKENVLIAKRNLYLPTFLFVATFLGMILFTYISNKKIQLFLQLLLIGVTVFDLFRLGWKFNPFTNQKFLFPTTKLISFLQERQGQFRVMSTDSRILPPNFSLIYHIQSVDGYDPLYLRRYAELIAASENGALTIDKPQFNRIITPHRYESKIIDLLGVKYILSFSDLSSPKLRKVFQEGETKVYENQFAIPRAFFVRRVISAQTRNESLAAMFMTDFNPRNTAVIEDDLRNNTVFFAQTEERESIKDIKYSENKVVIDTKNDQDAFLVLTDSYYPNWNVKIYSKDSGKIVNTKIYKTDFNFRGVVVPKGKNRIEFFMSLIPEI